MEKAKGIDWGSQDAFIGNLGEKVLSYYSWYYDTYNKPHPDDLR